MKFKNLDKSILIRSKVLHTFLDWPDPISTAVIIEFVGCNNRCPNCHNALTLANDDVIKERIKSEKEYCMSIEPGMQFDSIPEKSDIFKYLSFEDSEKGLDMFFSYVYYVSKRYRTNCIIFQGGDPLYIHNRNFVCNFLKKYHENEFGLRFCVYTGYPIDEVKKLDIHADYFKCGRYDQNLKQAVGKTDKYFQLASSNQGIFDGSTYKELSKNGRLEFINLPN